MSLSARLTGPTLALGMLAGLLTGCASTSETAGGESADAGKPEAAEAAPDSLEPDSWEESRPRDPNVVTAEDIARSPSEPIEKILEGRIAGVEVRQTRNGLEVRIRGQTSLRGDTAPLYVIDGVPIEPGPGGALAGISAYDIESIRVLKDVADTSMYGVRGANGVIVVTTKHPPPPE